ncbi:hypothetical protein GOBAR_DD05234 [Gossypium barbadense]|nr:hypothetical protein GOBAR_DD05234 [Gossypium barbadense]
MTNTKDNKVEEVKESEEISKAFAAVAGVRKEVDKLSERIAALEVAVNSGTKVTDEEFVVPAELLMRELLKLDGIGAEGEARLQRKAELCYMRSIGLVLFNIHLNRIVNGIYPVPGSLWPSCLGMLCVVSMFAPLVRRIQKYHETLDKLKTINSNPFSDKHKAVSVTTNWETFDS